MFDNWLNRLIKVTTLLSVISLVIGAMVIYNHLNAIGFNGLFSDAISIHTILIPILLYIMMIIACMFVIPFLSLPLVYQEYKLANDGTQRNNDPDSNKRRGKAILYALLLYAIIFIILVFTSKNLFWLFTATIFFTMPYLSFFLFKKINYGQFRISLSKKEFGNIALITVCHLCFICTVGFFYLAGYAWFTQKWVLFLLAIFFCTINSLPLLASVCKEETDIPAKVYYIFSISILFCFGFLFTTVEQSMFINDALIKLGYVEDESKSKLYVISDNVFALNKEKDNNLLLSVVRNHFLHVKPNVYYGYMAWNVGEIKVFCPHNTNKEYYKCLPIKRDYLQLVPVSSDKMAIEITSVYLENFSYKISEIEPNVSMLLQTIAKELHENS